MSDEFILGVEDVHIRFIGFTSESVCPLHVIDVSEPKLQRAV